MKLQRSNLLTSLVLIAPLFVIYQIGVLFTLPMLNGADFVTTFLLHTMGLSLGAYLAFVGGVVLLFAIALSRLKKKESFQSGLIVMTLAESAVWAAGMGSLIIFVMTSLLGFEPGLRIQLAGGLAGESALSRLVMSVGAGLYEELVFRLGIMMGLVWLFQKGLRRSRAVAVIAAFGISAFLFSAMHHIPPYGDELSLGVFTFRFLAGLFFGALFWWRGLAVAVYTHALYDVFVLLIR